MLRGCEKGGRCAQCVWHHSGITYPDAADDTKHKEPLEVARGDERGPERAHACGTDTGTQGVRGAQGCSAGHSCAMRRILHESDSGTAIRAHTTHAAQHSTHSAAHTCMHVFATGCAFVRPRLPARSIQACVCKDAPLRRRATTRERFRPCLQHHDTR